MYGLEYSVGHHMRKTISQILRDIDDSEVRKQISLKIKERTNINKKRAKVMERHVARILHGYRVPMSGAGSLKGDVIVNTPAGSFLVECKSSSAKKNDKKYIFILKDTFEKTKTSAQRMHYPFWCVIFKFYREGEHWVLVPRFFMERIFDTFQIPFDYSSLRTDIKYKQTQMSVKFLFEDIKDVRAGCLVLFDTEFFIFDLETFAEYVRDTSL